MDDIRLAVQQALLGAVTPNLRAITVDCGEDCVRIEALVDQPPSEIDLEAISQVETEMLAWSDPSHGVDVRITTWPAPGPIRGGRFWAYLRWEPDGGP